MEHQLSREEFNRAAGRSVSSLLLLLCLDSISEFHDHKLQHKSEIMACWRWLFFVQNHFNEFPTNFQKYLQNLSARKPLRRVTIELKNALACIATKPLGFGVLFGLKLALGVDAHHLLVGAALEHKQKVGSSTGRLQWLVDPRDHRWSMTSWRVEMEFAVDGEETLYSSDMCLHFNAWIHDGQIDGVDDWREELKNVGNVISRVIEMIWEVY